MTTTPPSITDMTFEESLRILQEIVASLEAGNLTLEETITTFRSGAEVARHCQAIIESAELRITQLESSDGPDVVPTES